ncbi:MAG: RNA polymerase sigma factor [Myxococcota bacterium]
MLEFDFFGWLVMSFSRRGNQAETRGSRPQTPPAAPTNAKPSFEAVFRAHYEFVYASVRRLGITEAAVDDAVQDVFVVVARRLAEFEGRSTMRTWLFAIAARVVRHQRRTQARHARKLDALSQAALLVARVDTLSQRESARLLYRLLDTLDEGKREVYVLMELQQLTAAEVGAMLGLKTPTVHSRLRLARAALRETVATLQEEGADG